MIGSTLYNLVITNGIAVYFIEKLVWGSAVRAAGALEHIYDQLIDIRAIYRDPAGHDAD